MNYVARHSKDASSLKGIQEFRESVQKRYADDIGYLEVAIANAEEQQASDVGK
jgi:hypothetical protein